MPSTQPWPRVAVAPLPAAAAQRTFVASTGLDTNPCSITAPCRGIARALTQTDPNGEVIVLDSAGSGAFTISQSVSVIAPPGVYAGISVFSGNGISIARGARVEIDAIAVVDGRGMGQRPRAIRSDRHNRMVLNDAPSVIGGGYAGGFDSLVISGIFESDENRFDCPDVIRHITPMGKIAVGDLLLHFRNRGLDPRYHAAPVQVWLEMEQGGGKEGERVVLVSLSGESFVKRAEDLKDSVEQRHRILRRDPFPKPPARPAQANDPNAATPSTP